MHLNKALPFRKDGWTMLEEQGFSNGGQRVPTPCDHGIVTNEVDVDSVVLIQSRLPLESWRTRAISESKGISMLGDANLSIGINVDSVIRTEREKPSIRDVSEACLLQSIVEKNHPKPFGPSLLQQEVDVDSLIRINQRVQHQAERVAQLKTAVKHRQEKVALQRQAHSEHTGNITPKEQEAISSPSCDDDLFKTSPGRFGLELAMIRGNESITDVNLCNFIGRCELDDLLAAAEILRTSTRRWKCIQLDDEIEGANYRRWLFRKERVCRALREALAGQENRGKVPIRVCGHLKIDMDELAPEAIGSILKDVEKDRCVRELTLEGFLTFQDMESVVGPLQELLSRGDRTWKGVAVRVSFDGDILRDFSKWDTKVRIASYRLEKVSACLNIPLEFSVC